MYRTSKEALNNFPWSRVAGQNEPKVSFEERPNVMIACRATPQLPVSAATLRHSGHVEIIQKFQNLFLTTVFLLCTPVCFAERADRDQPLLLEADQVQIDDMHQTSTFIGNVQLAQGTMLIRGDKIVMVQHKDGFKQAVAHGNTASFRQKREGLDEYVEGYGERIEYDTRAGTVDFYVQARVKRELDEVRGDHITYNVKTEIFQVSSSASSVDGPSKRVRAVLQPKPKDGATAPSTQGALPGTPGKTLTSPRNENE